MSRVITHHVVDDGIVVAVLHVGRVPVDETTGPLDCALSVLGETSWPEGELHASRRLRVVVVLAGIVVGIRLLQCPHDIAINSPFNLVRSPVDSIVVLVLSSVGDRQVLAVLVVGDTLEVVVRLSVLEINADPFEIDFVLDVAHQDESGNDTLTLGGSHVGAYGTVPHVVCAGKKSADGVGSHGQKHGLVLVDSRRAGADPVGLAGITEVCCVWRDIAHAVHCKVARLAGRCRHA